MLKGLDPLLGPEALSVLRTMGYGDEVVIVDAHFSVDRVATRPVRRDDIAGLDHGIRDGH